jgi:hypothetical protein
MKVTQHEVLGTQHEVLGWRFFYELAVLPGTSEKISSLGKRSIDRPWRDGSFQTTLTQHLVLAYFHSSLAGGAHHWVVSRSTWRAIIIAPLSSLSDSMSVYSVGPKEEIFSPAGSVKRL